MSNKEIILKISTFLELLRIIGTFLAILLGYLLLSPTSYQHSLNIFMLLFVLSLNGITGLESLFFGAQGSKSIGRRIDRPYQLQSAVNCLATSIMSVVVFLLNWGPYASLTVVFTTFLFVVLSACVHTWEVFSGNNTTHKNILRPIMTLILCLAVIPLLSAYLRAL